MQSSEYQNIHENEKKHFYYISNQRLVLQFAGMYLKNKGSECKILDAGCGTGFLAKKIKNFGKVWGVDISPHAVRLAKKRGIKVSKASITKLPFKTNTFDLIISIDVLYHQDVNNDQKAIQEFARVLKPSGILIIKVPAYNWLRGKHDIVVQTKKRYCAKDLADLVNKSNLLPQKITYLYSFLLPIAILKRFAEKVLNTAPTSDVKTPNVIVNYLFISIFSVERFLLNFLNLPFGLSVLCIAKKPGLPATVDK